MHTPVLLLNPREFRFAEYLSEIGEAPEHFHEQWVRGLNTIPTVEQLRAVLLVCRMWNRVEDCDCAGNMVLGQFIHRMIKHFREHGLPVGSI